AAVAQVASDKIEGASTGISRVILIMWIVPSRCRGTMPVQLLSREAFTSLRVVTAAHDRAVNLQRAKLIGACATTDDSRGHHRVIARAFVSRGSDLRNLCKPPR